MLRTILGILAGIILAALALYGAQYGYAYLHPSPPGTAPGTPEAVASFLVNGRPNDVLNYVNTAPTEALSSLLGGWVLAALLGGWLGAAIAKPHRGGTATLIGALLTVLVIVYGTLIPGPPWVTVLGVLLPMPFALLGGRLAMPRHEF